MRKYNLRMGVKIGIIYIKYMPKKNERFFFGCFIFTELLIFRIFYPFNLCRKKTLDYIL